MVTSLWKNQVTPLFFKHSLPAPPTASSLAVLKKTWREVTGTCQYPVGGKFHSAHHFGDLDIVDLFNEGRL